MPSSPCTSVKEKQHPRLSVGDRENRWKRFFISARPKAPPDVGGTLPTDFTESEFETHIALLPAAPRVCTLAIGHPGNFSTARSSQLFNKLFYLIQVEHEHDRRRGER